MCAPTHTSSPCSHLLQICICLHLLVFFPAHCHLCPFLPTAHSHPFIICVHSYLLAMHTSWSSNPWATCIHVNVLSYVPMCQCLLSFTPAVCARSYLQPMHTLSCLCSCSAPLCVFPPAVVGCNTLYYLSHIINI